MMKVITIEGDLPGARQAELRAGWHSLAGVVLAFIAGVFCLPYYTAGLFIVPLHDAFGWSRTLVASGTSIMMACFVVTSPLYGMLTDKVDPRRLVPIGMIAVAIGLFVLSRSPNSPTFYLSTIAGLAIVGNLCGTVAMMPILTGSFVAARGTAIGIAMAGIGVGAAIGNPLIGQIIAEHGWRAAYATMSGFSIVSAPIVYLLLRAGRRPVAGRVVVAVTHSGASVRSTLSAPTFWVLAIAILAVALGSSGLVIHFVPLLVDEGLDASQAAWIASLIGICVIGGRLITGYLLDHMFAPKLAAYLMLVSAVCFIVFLLGGANFALSLTIAVGLSFGAEVDLVGYMVSRYFGLRNYGRLFGISYSLCIVGMMLSPLLFGQIRDDLGSYRPMIIISVMLLLAAAALFWRLPAYPTRAAESDPDHIKD